MPTSRRALLAAAAALPLAAPAALRAQPRYPDRPVRVIVPFAAGGIIDVVARLVNEPLARELGQPFVIENQPGAGSTIGARTVARARPDGYTLMINGAAQSVIPALYKDAGFDSVADFIPVGLVGDQTFLACVHPSVPVRDVPTLLSWLREKRGQATFATTGIGAASHLAGELLKSLAGVDFTVVTYRGTPAAVTDFIAGRIDMMIDSQTLLAPFVADGKARAVAVTTTRRSKLLPDLPTFAEAGVADYRASSFQAMYAPAGTPAPIVQTLSAALLKVLADPAVQESFTARGVDPMPGDSAAARRFLEAESAKWVPILERTGATAG
ncbi:Bug family tripartite tricarboxylate transporter substrate binding protein [Falsiroseomonas tokyonensis]|uniref:Bug family tripartite tricarboxylate transporter substrate binding protein n=1 Tax=Falsiroseomonas tokyonensis TaxID=430521 RepID=A0ABV7BPA3_9PROT|nr:tripartite tricarboxylate transporter substrate binding protein [Falsiroseomonas tokyonensis]MBU8536659.1 tripartite tricarboxylate transporter substrate binding protein [Falsiroseomonas tokyonensis]